MLYLYTENFYLWPRAKTQIKKLLGKEHRGPQAVLQSLQRGFKALGLDYRMDEIISQPVASAGVLSGVKTLLWAIGQKKAGRIKKLAAGPSIAVTPRDYSALMASPEIDTVIVPSDWNRRWWVSLNPGLEPKIKVWAAGVRDSGELVSPEGQCLVFKKDVPENVFLGVMEILKKLNLAFEVLEYGRFSPEQYRDSLAKSKFMVYLTQSESQGMALHEAWMAGVPTLVWDQGFYSYKGYRWADEKISAPYLTPECGLFFKGPEDFENRLDIFLKNYQNFTPRRYSLSNFTDAICAKRYLELL
jgi:hypothetical protein